jgi:hypothetical protein|tara:strand:+ start:314 stop:595 length:282 start_codon:yes stop_codon:yes gene_type:complete
MGLLHHIVEVIAGSIRYSILATGKSETYLLGCIPRTGPAHERVNYLATEITRLQHPVLAMSAARPREGLPRLVNANIHDQSSKKDSGTGNWSG